jgi:hypothetical protein
MMSKINALLLGFIFASQTAFAMEPENLNVALQDRETLENALQALSKDAPKIKIMIFGNDENKEDSIVIIKKFFKISLDNYVLSNDPIAYKKYSQNLLVFGNKISFDILDIKVPFIIDEAAQDEMIAYIADQIKEDVDNYIFIWIAKMNERLSLNKLYIITLLNNKLLSIKAPKRIDKLGVVLASCTHMPISYESEELKELIKKQRLYARQTPEEREKINSMRNEQHRKCCKRLQNDRHDYWKSSTSSANIELFFADYESESALYGAFGALTLLSKKKPEVEFIKLIGQLTDAPQIFGTLAAIVFSQTSNQNLILKDELDNDDFEVVYDWLKKHPNTPLSQ